MQHVDRPIPLLGCDQYGGSVVLSRGSNFGIRHLLANAQEMANRIIRTILIPRDLALFVNGRRDLCTACLPALDVIRRCQLQHLLEGAFGILETLLVEP